LVCLVEELVLSTWRLLLLLLLVIAAVSSSSRRLILLLLLLLLHGLVLYCQVSPPALKSVTQIPEGVHVRLAGSALLLLLLAGILLLLLCATLLLQGRHLAALCCPCRAHHRLSSSISSICGLLLLL
jgi:hypothetical protein